MSQPHAGRGGGKLPVNFCLGHVARGFNCCELAIAGRFGRYAPVPRLPSKDAEFALRHIEPTPVLGGVMKLQLLPQASELPFLLDDIAGFQHGQRECDRQGEASRLSSLLTNKR